jgi:NADH-quinone oxidoreductase subunit G
MSDGLVRLTIDGVRISVPEGTLIVDAAKRAGIDIPVFCYHPKMEPVGMCRMCLVEIGRPVRDRATGKLQLAQDGQPVVSFGPKLETACTTPVGEGWVVRGLTDKVKEARREVLEFLLTSHPLDCPICDKGGECPLQNLTLAHGPGKSRFLVDDKMHLDKHFPLGDLIFLDRERCIQCGRCVRYQEEVVGEAVLGFTQRGRHLEITTLSDPGFDSVFSGNTTDLCPVGALTTADFRFEARPWELMAAASICPHCPVGCNLTLNTRRQPSRDGQILVQRVMPRQNETVNEIWICDKGRFAHHFAASPERLSLPLVRSGTDLVEATWEQALARASEGLRGAGAGLLGIAGGRASNEDLFNFRRLVEGLGGRPILHEAMAGGDLVRQVGVGTGTDLGRLGPGDAVLVIASDLQEEAPIWWHRLKQAADRGAALIVANARPTKLDRHAAQVVRYAPGRAAHAALGMLQAVSGRSDLAGYMGDAGLQAAAGTLAAALNVLVFFGTEGLDYAGSLALAQACAGLLAASGHVGHPGNGLIAVWPHSNSQGAWDMGLRPEPQGLTAPLAGASGALLMACDPVGDDPQSAEMLRALGFVVVLELFLTETARLADVVFPAQAFTEREGTLTSGERQVQRFFPAVPARPGCRPDWMISAELGEKLGIPLEASSPAAVMQAIAREIPDYAGISYELLARLEPQWPIVGGRDLYYGGTAYRNEQGLGQRLPSAAERGEVFEWRWSAPPEPPAGGDLRLVPVTRLYDRGRTVVPSAVLLPRLAEARLEIGPADAARIGVMEGGQVEVRCSGRVVSLAVRVREEVPAGIGLVPRSAGVPMEGPVSVEVRPLGRGS